MERKGGSGRPGGGRRSWLRRRLPFILFLLSIGLAGVGAFEAQRALNSHQATADGLLSDYGAFAAWSFGRDVDRSFYSSLTDHFRPVYRAGTGQAGRAAPTAARLLEHSERLVANSPSDLSCGCSTYFGSPWFLRLPLDEPGRADLAGTAAPGVVAWLTEALPAAASEYRRHWPYAMINGNVGGRPVHVAYTVLRRGPGADLAYAMAIEPDRVVPVFEKVIHSCSLLPAALTGGRDNRDLLLFEVVAPDGSLLFASAEEQGSEILSDVAMDAMYGGLIVRAAVRPEIAGDLIIGGLPRTRLPFLLGVFGLGAALALLALSQLRREEELGLMRSDFVASVSHELRTPLAQIRLFLETLRLGRFKTEQQREWSLENIDRETQRLVNLVENVLHFSRAERGRMSSDRQRVDLAREAASAIAAFRPLARSRNASIECRVPEGLTVAVHRDSFRQVLVNLMDNAVKYGPPGQTVTVTGERTGDRVRVAVDDEGPGVPPAEREMVFEAYRRGESAVGTVAVGSGIGLSVVRQIVEHHDGRVRVESAPGGGARFVVELPAATTAPGTTDQNGARPSTEARRHAEVA